MREGLEVAHVLRQEWQKVEHHPQVNSWQLRTLGAVMRCRTAALGGHMDACTDCGTVRISYNSCRNRHCPKCQGKNREEWIAKRESELLPVPYFHVVFTLPDTLNLLAMHSPKEIYSTLFEAAWETVQCFGKDPKHLGVKTGMIAILHTWGQTMNLHPHLHCIVPGGGITASGKWKTAKSKGKPGCREARYLFPVKALSKVFRAKYVEKLKTKILLEKDLVNDLFKKDWVVYAKRPFGHPRAVIEYLGRYTHKIAISNHRIISIDKDKVEFTYKDYRKGGQKQQITLQPMEFIRRFSLHILPRAFVRIRHYGILSSTSKQVTVPEIRLQLKDRLQHHEEPRVLKKYNPNLCVCCGSETMVIVRLLPKRAPPGICLATSI